MQIVVTERSLRGIIARWAVQQSPYTCPEGLVAVLTGVALRFDHHPKKQHLGGMTFIVVEAEPSQMLAQMHGFVDSMLDGIEEFQKWNDRKNGRDGIGVVGRGLPTPDPDDDFVDLDALKRNVVISIFDEESRELREPYADDMLQHFDTRFALHHSVEGTSVIQAFASLAQRVVDFVPRNAERTVTLRKLLEAKDAVVRALRVKSPPPGPPSPPREPPIRVG